MESLQVRTGQIRLNILDDSGDSKGIFVFNPEDIESAKRVMELADEIEQSEQELFKKQEACKTDAEKIEVLIEIVDYYEDLIDKCFGEGTSELLFGDAKTLSMFFDFFEGIMPYYQKSSSERLAKYTKKKPSAKK